MIDNYAATVAKNHLIIRLEARKYYWERAKALQLKAKSNQVLLVGDRPGPSAPTDPHYHHTPFYSLKHCSGWLNKALEAENIPEKKLIWINSADQHGEYYNIAIVTSLEAGAIIALGGKASQWLKKHEIPGVIDSYHPQYWKRFHSKERYPLLDLLANLTTPVGNAA